jgi:hypothetical protein
MRFWNILNITIFNILLCAVLAEAIPLRQFDAVVVNGWMGSLYDLSFNKDVPDTDIVVYCYNRMTSTWRMITFQIDHRAPGDGGEYLFPRPKDGEIFYGNDEIVFMAKDCGDQAPQQVWIDDPSSRKYLRCEIKLTDPRTGTDGYVYVFRTDTPETHPWGSLMDYVSFVPDSDRVKSDYYQLTHNYKTNGNLTNLSIPVSAHGTGQDFLERMKLRAKGSFKWGSTTFPIKLTEENILRNNKPTVIDGRVRVLRRWNLKVSMELTAGFNVEYEGTFLSIFYPYWADFGVQPIAISGANLSYFRYSFDLDPTAYGMKMFCSISANWQAKFPNGVPIDNMNDTGLLPRNLIVPNWNWWMQTGSQGTLLVESYIAQLGSLQELYYKDSKDDGTNDPTSVGSKDTGLNGSWGDTGAKFTGSGITNQLPIKAQLYFLGAGVTADSAWVIRDMIANPIQISVGGTFVPVELTSFTVSSEKNNIALHWTTATETNNLGFSIERRFEGEPWRQIGFVKGAGTVAMNRTYSFNDHSIKIGSVSYRLKQIDLDGSFRYYADKSTLIAVPAKLQLAQNYPNPFNPETTIAFEVPLQATGDVRVFVSDLLGRTIRILRDGPAEAGYHQVLWDGRNDEGATVSSGIYFYTLMCGDERVTKRMAKIK